MIMDFKNDDMFINSHKNFFVISSQLAKLDDYIYKEIKP